jgi:hypothetical protein
VVRANHTRIEDVEASRDKLVNDRTPLVGTVLNSWEPDAHDEHYKAYSGYPTVFD